MPDDLAPGAVTALHPDLPAPTGGDAITLHMECQRLVDAEQEIVRLDDELKAAKEYRDYLARVVVPEAMQHAQVSSYALPTGEVVSIEHRLHCHVLKPQKTAVLAWIKTLGKSDLLTCTMSVAFARNEYAAAREFAKRAAVCLGDEKPRLVVEEWDIHSQTLKKFVGDTFYKTGRLAEIHPGVQYFNENVAVVTRVGAETENPLV